MICKLNKKKQEIRLIPQNDIDIFDLGKIFGKSKLPCTMVCVNSKLEFVAIKTKNLWPYICRVRGL
jgi:hypothetical protein